MPLVTMKDKGQVTIPAAIRDEIDAHQGDVFEVVVSEGCIILKPQDVVSRATRQERLAARSGVDITPWIGSGKGLFKTPEEVDAFIRAERAQWD